MVFAQEQQACNLTCNNRGKCVMKPADFSDHPVDEFGNPFEFHNVTEINGASCECEVGFTGVNCDVSSDFCDDGTHPCYHNGTCVEGKVESSVVVVHVCDCTTAVEYGIAYLGPYCEDASPVSYPVEEPPLDGVMQCDDGTGSRFCINGGICIDPYVDGGDACDCPAEYQGYHCEYHETTIPGAITCDIVCQNDGTCQIGFRNATGAEVLYDPNVSLMDVNDLLQFCNCPTGYSGNYCELYQEDCGEVYCFHGSTCMMIPDETGSGSMEPYCACDNNGTHSFAGVGCQVHSTSFCTVGEGVNGYQFCTNEGKCNLIGDGIYNCTCSDGFHGPHCEFPSITPAPESYKRCSLKCQNEGVCAEGIKDNGILNGLDDIEHLVNTSDVTSMEHCICPTGYAGILCEHVINVCPGGEHVCFFHGSDCVADEGDTYTCDCATSEENGVATAGEFCQHEATAVCDVSGEQFCVNNGTCSGSSCICQEPYRGPRCEFKMVPADFDGVPANDDLIVLPPSYEEPANNSIILASAVVAICAVLVIVVAVVFTSRHTESFDTGINVPPLSAFPPSPKSMVADSDVSVNDNGSFMESPGGADSTFDLRSDGGVVEDTNLEEERVNEII